MIGHTIASIFGSDPKHQIDEDLARFKSLLEDSKTTAKGGEVTRDELVAEASHIGDNGNRQSPTA